MEKTKKKAAYSIGSNLKYVLNNMWKCSKSLTSLCFLRAPFVVASAFLGVVLSRQVVAAVTSGASPQALITQIFLLSLGIMLALCGSKLLDGQLNRFMSGHDFYYQMLLFDKTIDSDYQNMDSPEGLNRLSKAMENTGSDNRGARLVAWKLTSVLENTIGAVLYGVLLFPLSPWLLLLVAVTSLGGFFFTKLLTVWVFNNKGKWKTDDRKVDYVNERSKDFTMAKDLRVYGMTGWLRRIFAETLGARMSWMKKEIKVGLATDSAQNFISLLREGIAYGGLMLLMVTQGLPVADFVLYFGLIGGLSGWLTQLSRDFDQLYTFHLGFCELRTFMDCPDVSNRGPGPELPKESFSVEFRHVSFRYPGSEADTLCDLSFKIKKGEKLAIVGRNGAGKTTLVKLLCGLYEPTEGEILIDGTPLKDFNRPAYFKTIAAVFQDIFLLPSSLAENVAAVPVEQVDRKKAEEALRLAGLWDKVEGLPKGMDTRLVKSVYDDSIDLSGGELQKLALARALYKGGQALVLDEPTAALDPIAESRVYTEYNRMTKGKTALFISHRLASTRFCDRIFYLEQGAVVECGSHDALMAQQGKYREMFDLQSHYYKEEVAENDL